MLLSGLTAMKQHAMLLLPGPAFATQKATRFRTSLRKKSSGSMRTPSVCEAKMEATNASQLCRRKVDGQKFQKKPDISTTE